MRRSGRLARQGTLPSAGLAFCLPSPSPHPPETYLAGRSAQCGGFIHKRAADVIAPSPTPHEPSTYRGGQGGPSSPSPDCLPFAKLPCPPLLVPFALSAFSTPRCLSGCLRPVSPSNTLPCHTQHPYHGFLPVLFLPAAVTVSCLRSAAKRAAERLGGRQPPGYRAAVRSVWPIQWSAGALPSLAGGSAM